MVKRFAIAFGAAALMASVGGGVATAEVPAAPDRGDVGAQCWSESPETPQGVFGKIVHVQYGDCGPMGGVMVSLDTSNGKGAYDCKPLDANGYVEFAVARSVDVYGSYYC